MNFDEISKKVKKFSKNTVEEVQKMNEVRILNGKISDAKKQVNQLYLEMGKKLYEQYKEAPFEGFETEIRTITEKKELIGQIKEQVRTVKGVVLCPCCNTEVPKGERFCSNCGNKMPEVVDPEDFEDAVVVEAEDVTEAQPAEGSEEDAAEENDRPVEEDAAEETVEAEQPEAERVEEQPEEAQVEEQPEEQPEEAQVEEQPEE